MCCYPEEVYLCGNTLLKQMLNEKSGNKKKGQLNKWLNQTERAEKADIKPPSDGKSVLLL